VREYQTKILSSPDELEELQERCSSKRLLAVDTETTGLNSWGKDYICGISLAWDDEPKPWSVYIPIRHEDITLPEQGNLFTENGIGYERKARNLEPSTVLAFLHPILEDPEVAKVFHNAPFDINMFRREGIEVFPIHDTKLMAYLLNELDKHSLKPLAQKYLGASIATKNEVDLWLKKHDMSIRDGLHKAPIDLVGRYAVDDTIYTLELFHLWSGKIKRDFLKLYQLERDLAFAVADIEWGGIPISTPHLEESIREANEELSQLEEIVYSAAGKRFDILSPMQTAEVLFGDLELVPKKRTAAGDFSSDEESLKAMEHPVADAIIDYRKIYKVLHTYLRPIQAGTIKGYVHPSLNQVAREEDQVRKGKGGRTVRTGRLSCSEPNFQNIPARNKKQMSLVRGAVQPPDSGYELASTDQSQVEMRILAEFSGDPRLIGVFLPGGAGDIYVVGAEILFDVTPQAALAGGKESPRQWAKTCVLGISYGMGAKKLARTMTSVGHPIAEEESYDFLNMIYSKLPGLRKAQRDAMRQAESCGYVTTWLGRRRQLTEKEVRKALNSRVQGSSADVLKTAMLRAHKLFRGKKSRILMPIHDELLYLHWKEENLIPEVEKALSDFPFKVPILVKTSRSDVSWAELGD